MSMNNIRKPDSLVKAVERVTKLCPYYPDNADEGKKMDMDSAIAELKSTFREYADLIEREVIKLTRIYQEEYEEMWQKVIEENEVFSINLDSLMKKNRHLEDKLHGFIAVKADTIFEYSKREFNGILRCNIVYSEGSITNHVRCDSSQLPKYLMNYIDKSIGIGIRQMSKYISNVLYSHDKLIRNKCFRTNSIPFESVKEKNSIKNSFSRKYRSIRYKTANLKLKNDFCSALAVITKSIMEN